MPVTDVVEGGEGRYVEADVWEAGRGRCVGKYISWHVGETDVAGGGRKAYVVAGMLRLVWRLSGGPGRCIRG